MQMQTRNADVPVLSLADWRAGSPGARDRLVATLRHALHEVGFYMLVDHGIDWALVEEVFEAARRFHALPLETKLALKANRHNVGYMPVRGSVTRATPVGEEAALPNVVEAFFLKRDLPPDHPDVLADRPFRCANQWPDPELLPGFRETTMHYAAEIERLCLDLLPLYALALDLPEDFFREAFADPQFSLRLSHYPPVEGYAEREYGLAPHSDSSFLTMLPQSGAEGLSIRLPDDRWIDIPVIERTIVVNSGDLLKRWSNDRVLSTPHRAVNRGEGDRYAVPFFFDCSGGYEMACLPSCTDADNPPRYPPVTYIDYMLWFTNRNYAHVRQDPAGPFGS